METDGAGKPESGPAKTGDSAPHALIFDSGLGGLSIARAIVRDHPEWAFSYVADSAFFPYGTKSDAALLARLPRLLATLCAHVTELAAIAHAPRVDRVVIACNTASTLALQGIRGALGDQAAPGQMPIPVVGVVPAIKPAATLTRTGVIGLLATPGTVRRSYTDRLIADFASDCHVVRHGSATLVELAERSASGAEIPEAEFRAALAPMFSAPRGEEIDVVVLACTHFPLVTEALVSVAPSGVRFIDSSEAVARQTARVRPEGPASLTGSRGWRRAFVVGDAADAARLDPASRRLGFAPAVALGAEIAERTISRLAD